MGAGVRIEASSAIRVARMTLVRNRSYGLKVKRSRDVRVTRNRITRNETGVEISGRLEGVVIADNDIYRNDRLIVNDPAPGNDRGANGTLFHTTTGHIRVTGNRIWGNRGPSHDWVNDGGAFELCAASNLEISHNVVWDNENVMETGTDGSGPCANNRFFRNVAYAGGRLPSGGMILRCASGMLVANNTLAELPRFAFDVDIDGRYGGSVAGLRIVNNVASSATATRASWPSSRAGAGSSAAAWRQTRCFEIPRAMLQAVAQVPGGRPSSACFRRDGLSTRSRGRSWPLGDGLALVATTHTGYLCFIGFNSAAVGSRRAAPVDRSR
jgi:hypothetical protein